MVIKEDIVSKAGGLFLRRGCKSVTMDDVAQENGISKRTLYENFPDKAALLEACIQNIGIKNIRFLQAVYDKSANILEFFLMLHEFQTEAVINMHDNFYDEVKKYYPDVFSRTVVPVQSEYVERLENMLKKGQEEGVFRSDINVEFTAIVLSEIIDMDKSPRLFNRSSISKLSQKEIMREAVLSYFRGLSTLKGISIIDRFMEKHRKGEFMYANVRAHVLKALYV